MDEFDPGRPLWGIPFAVKDNIDAAGIPTTAACPAYAYTPQEDAFVVAKLRAGLVHVSQKGASVAVEIWSLPLAEFDGFLQAIPAPLGIGSVELSDGTTVKGFVCEAYGVEDGEDITHLADWRKYLSRLEQQDDCS